MNLSRIGALIILLAGMVGAPSAFSQYVPGGPKLRGTITSPDGKPLEGVTVSIRGAGKTFVTSVFTNLQGVYVFPPVEKGSNTACGPRLRDSRPLGSMWMPATARSNKSPDCSFSRWRISRSS